MGWVVNATLRPLYPRERPDTHCIGGWVGPGGRPGRMRKISLPTGIRSPDCPARSVSLYEKMWKNTVQPDRLQMRIRRMCIVCRIPKVTDTHTEYVILIAFPLQQWQHEHASILRLYIHLLPCCVCFYLYFCKFHYTRTLA